MRLFLIEDFAAGWMGNESQISWCRARAVASLGGDNTGGCNPSLWTQLVTRCDAIDRLEIQQFYAEPVAMAALFYDALQSR